MARSAAGYELASVGTRFIALVIDAIILGVIGWVVGLVLGNAGTGGFIGFLIGIAYQWYFLTQQNGQTPGKKMMGIRVIKVSGEPLQPADVIVRYIGYYINTAIIFLGWIWAFFDANSQGWHDKLAGTYVVQA
ncbi:MAG: RDD family protein [Chloroflexota bacterium]